MHGGCKDASKCRLTRSERVNPKGFGILFIFGGKSCLKSCTEAAWMHFLEQKCVNKCVRRLQGGEQVQVDALGARQPERYRDITHFFVENVV